MASLKLYSNFIHLLLPASFGLFLGIIIYHFFHEPSPSEVQQQLEELEQTVKESKYPN